MTTPGRSALRVILAWLACVAVAHADVVTLADADLVVLGSVAGDDTGFSVSSAGDVNGDGFDDLLIGSRLSDTSANSAGSVTLVFGGPSAPAAIDLASPPASGVVTFFGAVAFDQLGRAVRGIGDVNGDGFDDLGLGAPLADYEGRSSSGCVYIVYGADDLPTTLNVANLGARGVVIGGAAAGDRLGQSVASAGDFNGDGLADLVVGAPRGDGSQGLDVGHATVLFGRTDWPGTLDLVNLDTTGGGVRFEGAAAGDRFGTAVATAGDFNADGTDDLVVGAELADPAGDQSGEATILFGDASFPTLVTIDTINAGAVSGVVIPGASDRDHLGYAVGAAGDFNGDGIDDVIVAADDGGPLESGEAYILFGSANPAVAIDTSNPASLFGAGVIVRGANPLDFFGRSVAALGDFDGDRRDDVVIGAPGFDDAGRVSVILGRDNPPAIIDVATDLQTLTYEGEVPGDDAGESVALAGDFDGDGAPDLIVGAPDAGAGAAYVLLGLLPPCEAPTILASPLDVAACVGEPVQLTASVSGTDLEFQWRRDGVDLAGETAATLTIDALTLEDDALYSLVITNSCGTAATSDVRITVDNSPALVAPPAAITLCEGETLTIALVADGTEPLSFEWRHQGVLLAETTEALEIAAVTAADAGDYQVTVSNHCGSVVHTVSVAINTALEIVSAPESAILCPGDALDLTVEVASGLPVALQWRKDGVELAGETGVQLLIASIAAGDAADYDCVVTTSCESVITPAATLTVAALPEVTVSAPVTVCEGESITISTVATSDLPVSIQWQLNGVDLDGEILGTLTRDAATLADAGDYTVVATNDCGTTVSTAIVVTVEAVPTITAAPASTATCIGGDATLTVVATGAGELTYQWRRDGAELDGETSPTLQLTALTESAEYDVRVTNHCGETISAPAAVDVLTLPAISEQPLGQSVCEGDAIALTVTATGPELTYQWRKDGEAIPGATSETFEIATTTVGDAGRYDVEIVNGCGSTTSASAAVEVAVAPTVTKAPVDSVVCLGESVALTANAEGTAPLAYQWRFNGTDIEGATGTTLSIAVVQEADFGSYDVVVTNGCGVATSNPVAVVRADAPVLTVAPADQAVCEGTPLTLTVAAESALPLEYQWRHDGVELAGANGATLTIDSADLDHAGAYDVVVTNRCGETISAPAAVTVDLRPRVAFIETQYTLCPGDSIELAPALAGAAPLTFQWWKNGEELVGAIEPTLILDAVSESAEYNLIVSNHCGAEVSTSIVVSLIELPTVVAPLESPVACPGDDVVLVAEIAPLEDVALQWQKDGVDLAGQNGLSLNLPAVTAADAGEYTLVATQSCMTLTTVGTLSVLDVVTVDVSPTAIDTCFGSDVVIDATAFGTGPFDFQWSKDGVEIAGATDASLAFDAVTLDAIGEYAVVVTGACGTATSATITVDVDELPAVLDESVDQILCAGNPLELIVALESERPVTYQWRCNAAPIDGATDATLTIESATAADSGIYDVVITQDCGEIVVDRGIVEVREIPSIAVEPQDQAVCLGAPVAFDVTAIGAELRYQWRFEGTPILGATSPQFTVDALTLAGLGVYDVVIENDCGAITSAPAQVTTATQPTLLATPIDQEVCVDDTVLLTVEVASVEGTTYQWFRNGEALDGETAATLDLSPIALDDEAAYSCRVIDACGTITTAPAFLTVDAVPTIVEEPTDLTLCPGESGVFSFAFESRAAATIEWRHDGVLIDGADTTSLALDAIDASAAGLYSAAITNRCGTVTTAEARLTVREVVAIVAQPIPSTQCLGESTTLSVSATGSELAYQWRKNGVAIDGAVNAELVFDALTTEDEASYDVVVTNPCNSITSETVFLAVGDVPTITADPQGTLVCLGETVTLTAAAEGTEPILYQWTKNGAPIAGATATTLEVSATDLASGGVFEFVATNLCGDTVSAAAEITVIERPAVVAAPESQTICDGEGVLFSVTAESVLPIAYQWRKDGVAIAGATSADFAIDTATDADAGSYDVLLTNDCGESVSPAALLEIRHVPTIVADPADAVACVGETVTFAIDVDSDLPTSIEWTRDGAPIAGATALTLEVTAELALDGTRYAAIVSNSCGSRTSIEATLDVLPVLEIVASPIDTLVCESTPFALEVIATGAEPLTYQWRKDGQPIADATASVLAIDAALLESAGVYDVVVTSACTEETSAAALVTVDALPRVELVSAPSQVCVGESATLQVAATGTEPLEFAWFHNGAPIAGATSSLLTLEALDPTSAGEYSVTVTNGCSTASLTHNIEMTAPPVITTEPTDVGACAGDSVSFSVQAISVNPIAYQWRLNGAPIAGATESTLTIESISGLDVGVYDVLLTNECGERQSQPAQLALWLAPEVVTAPVSQSVCEGDAAVFTVDVTGTTPLTYQWFVDGVLASEGNGATFTLPTLADASVSVTVSNRCGTITTDAAQLTMLPSPRIEFLSDDVILCPGASTTLEVAASGAAPLSYVWTKDGEEIGEGAILTLTDVTGADAGLYRAIAQNDCTAVESEAITVSVYAPLTIAQAPVDAVACRGGSAIFDVTIGGGDESLPLTYQWLFDGAPIVDATSPTLVIDDIAAADAGAYQCVATNGCGAITSPAAALEVAARPLVITAPLSGDYCAGEPLLLAVEAESPAEVSFQWIKNGTPLVGETASTLSIDSLTVADAGVYSVRVFNECGAVFPETATVDVTAVVEVFSAPTSVVIAAGDPHVFLVDAIGKSIDYQWRKDGVAIDGETASSLYFDAVSLTDEGAYDVVLTAPCGTTTTLPATLTVAAAASDLVVSACNADGITTICWEGTKPFEGFRVYRDGVEVATARATDSCVDVADDEGGVSTYRVFAELGGVLTLPVETSVVVLDTPEITASPLAFGEGTQDLQLRWTLDTPFDVVRVFRDFVFVGQTSDSTLIDLEVPEGARDYLLEFEYTDGDCTSTRSVNFSVDTLEPIFKRGDANNDGGVDISDPIFLLDWFFTNGPTPGCLDAADANDDGANDIADAVALLTFQFAGGAAPPAPGAVTCGPDPVDSDDTLECVTVSSSCQ